MEPIKVELTIPSLSDYVGVARLSAAGVATRMKFTHEDIEDIKIAVSEACTNAIQYAYGDEIGNINLTFLIHEKHLEIQVKDFGKGFDINSDFVKGVKDDKDKVGLGLGIVFMKSLMDKVKYNSSIANGTEVIMIKSLDTPVV